MVLLIVAGAGSDPPGVGVTEGEGAADLRHRLPAQTRRGSVLSWKAYSGPFTVPTP